jgi:hypothetical protein
VNIQGRKKSGKKFENYYYSQERDKSRPEKGTYYNQLIGALLKISYHMFTLNQE